MINMPRLKFTSFDALYNYISRLVRVPASRPRSIDDLIIDANSAGVGVTEENPGKWLNRNAVHYVPQHRPRLCGLFLPDEETLDAIEADDGAGDGTYPLPDFYAEMFEPDGSGSVQLKTLTPAKRKEFRKKRLADYMTQKCF